MTAQQQEPTMREEIARALFEHGRPGPDAGIPWDSPIRPEQARDHWREKADAVLAVLERRGDDDAARVLRARIEKLARQYERLSDELHLVPAADAFHDAALDLRRALTAATRPSEESEKGPRYDRQIDPREPRGMYL